MGWMQNGDSRRCRANAKACIAHQHVNGIRPIKVPLTQIRALTLRGLVHANHLGTVPTYNRVAYFQFLPKAGPGPALLVPVHMQL
jgi:hypothetical protein